MEGMYHPDVVSDLDGVDNAPGIPSMPKGDLENASAEALERLRNIGLLALRRDCQRAQDLELRRFGKETEVLSRRLDPRDRPSRLHERYCCHI